MVKTELLVQTFLFLSLELEEVKSVKPNILGKLEDKCFYSMYVLQFKCKSSARCNNKYIRLKLKKYK